MRERHKLYEKKTVLLTGLVIAILGLLLMIDPLGLFPQQSLSLPNIFNFTNLSTIVLGIFLYEVIKGIIASMSNRYTWRVLRIGFTKSFHPVFCKCDTAIRIKYYRIMNFLPFFFLGLLPFIMGLLFNSSNLLVTGFFFCVYSATEIRILILLFKEQANDFVIDHPTELGCYLYLRNRNK